MPASETTRGTPPAVPRAAGGGALDLHEGLSHPGPSELPGDDGRYRDPRRGGCLRWPEHLWLVSSHGERVPGRCKATNLCPYCARLVAVENTEMLALDAAEGEAPQVWCVLTTRTATLDMSGFYKARELVIRALKRRWPAVRYASLLEFSTGYGPRSGGLRRPHWNLLLKGIPLNAPERSPLHHSDWSLSADGGNVTRGAGGATPRRIKKARTAEGGSSAAAEGSSDVLRQVAEVVTRVWCDHVDAEPGGQYVGPVADAGGLMRYIALHFQKESQSPPAGFRGQRFNCSRDYFTGKTRAEAREDARLALREKRELWKLGQHTGLTGDELEDAYDAKLAAEGFPEWGLYGSKRPAVKPLAPGEVPHVALRLLEAAFRWRDEEELIADAWEARRV